MPQLPPPPQPIPILYPIRLQPTTVSSPAVERSAVLGVAKPTVSSSVDGSPQRAPAQPKQALSQAINDSLLKLSPPEDFAPEPSTLSSTNGAEALGNPLERTLSSSGSEGSLLASAVAQAPTLVIPGDEANQTEPEPIELKADRQDFDEAQRIFTAEGNVSMLFRGALLQADRLQVNLRNRLAAAEGNVSLTRGDQVLQGQRFEYNFVQGNGTIFNAKGEINNQTTERDFASDVTTGITTRSAGERIQAGQPQQVTSPGQITLTVGAGRDAPATQSGGDVRRIRYEAERIDFTAEGWVAQNVRITNDPFSPPELELRADRAQLTQISPTESLLETSQPRLVLDQTFAIPSPRSSAIIGRRPRGSGILQFGYDGSERGGLFVEQTFEPIPGERLQLTITPQIFIQKLAQEGSFTSPSSYGVRGELNYILGEQTSIRGSAIFNSLDLTQIETRLRASLRVRQMIGTHALAVEYSYRDRLFNGSLGFQDVQSSLGAVLTSPVIPLGDTGINLSYQAGAQYINATTDRSQLLRPNRTNDRVFLSRFQGSFDLSKGFTLWQGQALPATATEGLRYSPVPVVPYLGLFTGIRGVSSFYTSGDSQQTLTGSLTLQGQLGNFSRPFFDYTAFNIGYSQTLISGISPFLFDRTVDTRTLTGGFMQQIYGPFRFGIQTNFNLDTGKEISTEYIVEYARRTYAVNLRYNPVLQVGILGLRISDFNWTGDTEPFAGTGIRFVQTGVRQENE
ncbi:MAG: DUF3769 domain-containing protein [Leptolyngbyaceae cyanobacterium bins.59]|nr:DUF3769 domain-containing protein [Leptolyngbyaceae cyanobacterium bins.59]